MRNHSERFSTHTWSPWPEGWDWGMAEGYFPSIKEDVDQKESSHCQTVRKCSKWPRACGVRPMRRRVYLIWSVCFVKHMICNFILWLTVEVSLALVKRQRANFPSFLLLLCTHLFQWPSQLRRPTKLTKLWLVKTGIALPRFAKISSSR